MSKLWGGRFDKNTDKVVEEFTASLPFDCRLYKEDIAGSIAHVKMLAKCKILPDEEAEQIAEGLREIEREFEADRFSFDLADEDIHMSIERTLMQKIGPVGGKLHTARSRNDQVALDMRMYIKKEIKIVCELITSLKQTLMAGARDNIDVIMPGYTHMQRAQPILFAHHQMAHFFSLQRDFDRFKLCFDRADVMPLGSGALAGTSFPIDREFVAKELGFSRISENSLDAVSDRDFLLEFQFAASLMMVHLSRIAEELVLWSTQEFGFVELDDSYTTGSSIMPQKKNPDVAELIRGKTGRTFGNLLALLTTLKALPLAYNRDLQEDKEVVFDTLDNLKLLLSTLIGMLSTMQINKVRMEESAGGGFSTATDLADYLVKKGLSFREAHEVVGAIVKNCISDDLVFEQLKLDDFKRFSSFFESDVFDVLDARSSVESRASYGGTSSTSVKRQFQVAQQIIADEKAWIQLK